MGGLNGTESLLDRMQAQNLEKSIHESLQNLSNAKSTSTSHAKLNCPKLSRFQHRTLGKGRSINGLMDTVSRQNKEDRTTNHIEHDTYIYVENFLGLI